MIRANTRKLVLALAGLFGLRLNQPVKRASVRPRIETTRKRIPRSVNYRFCGGANEIKRRQRQTAACTLEVTEGLVRRVA